MSYRINVSLVDTKTGDNIHMNRISDLANPSKGYLKLFHASVKIHNAASELRGQKPSYQDMENGLLLILGELKPMLEATDPQRAFEEFIVALKKKPLGSLGVNVNE